MLRPLAFPTRGIGDGDLTLRRHRQDDVAALTAACQDPAIHRYTRVPSPYSEDDARGWILGTAELARQGAALHLVIVDPANTLLGAVAVQAIDRSNNRAEIGYWVERDARGRGVATRAVRLLATHAFDALGLERLTIFTEPENLASRRVAERAGFTPEGLMRGWLDVGGAQRDAIAHGRLRDDAPSSG